MEKCPQIRLKVKNFLKAEKSGETGRVRKGGSKGRKEPSKKSRITCPKCTREVKPPLKKIDPGLRLRLSKEEITEKHSDVCGSCFDELNRAVSKGAKLRAEQLAKEKSRQFLWKERLKLVKQGREFMEQKAYAEAAASYEKIHKSCGDRVQGPPGKSGTRSLEVPGR